jgi:hypothetical protein
MHQNNLRLGTKVMSKDGQALGEIKHLVMKQGSKEPSHVVIGGDPYANKMTQVEVSKFGSNSQDDGTLGLSLSKAEFEQLPEFNEKAFVEGRDYPADAAEAFGSQPTREFVTGGYSLDPDTNLNPPGLVNNPPENRSNNQ